MKNVFSFLAIGKTQVSTEAADAKKYIGVGSSYVLAVNPTKEELEKLYGHDIANAPEYVGERDGVPYVRIDFIVKTDPQQCDGVEVTNKATIFLRNEPAYNRDKTKVQVIDEFGNSTWAKVEDAKMNKRIVQANGQDAKVAPKYRMACSGEADLVDFLKAYLNIGDVFNYVNGSWIMKTENVEDYKFSFEHLKDYFKGDVSELREALALQPKNKIKLLYGVRTTDRGQFQSVVTRGEMVMRNSSGSSALTRLQKNVLNAKNSGAFSDTILEVCPLKEYTIEATNLANPVENGSDDTTEAAAEDMPWN